MTGNAMSTTSQPDSDQAAPVPPAPRRRRWWVSLLLGMVVFSSGFVVGGAAALIVARQRILNAIHHPEEAPTRITARLRGYLDLTDEQAAEVEKILRQRQAAFQAIRAEVQPRVMAELALVEEQVADVLDDSQQAKWHKRFAELRETWVPPDP